MQISKQLQLLFISFLQYRELPCLILGKFDVQSYFVLLGFHARLVVATSLSLAGIDVIYLSIYLLHPPFAARTDVPLSFFLKEEGWDCDVSGGCGYFVACQ